jgi:hypothetical protein
LFIGWLAGWLGKETFTYTNNSENQPNRLIFSIMYHSPYAIMMLETLIDAISAKSRT